MAGALCRVDRIEGDDIVSHAATNWAFHQVGLKPAAKLVLLALADCHNPVKGCFPSHEYLARICCISERSVRDQLDALEGAGLIRRTRINSGSGRKSNHYILGFEVEEDHPTANSAAGENDEAQRQISDSPTANSAATQRQILPPNPVKGTVRDKPPNPPRGAECVFEDFFEGWPNRENRHKAQSAWNKLSENERFLAIKNTNAFWAAWRKAHPTAAPMQAASYLRDRRWLDEFKPTAKVEDLDKRAKLIAEMKESPIPAVREQALRMEAAE